jgi:hypothetical protein
MEAGEPRLRQSARVASIPCHLLPPPALWPRPGGNHFLELQAGGKLSIAEPLAIDNPRLGAQVELEGSHFEEFSGLEGAVGMNARTMRANVFSIRALRLTRLLESKKLQWNPHAQSFLEAS